LVPLPEGELERLDECVREPIRIPGGIQPFGALLVADAEDLTVLQASAGAGGFLGTDTVLQGAALADVLPPDVVEALRDVLADEPGAANPVSALLGGREFDIVAHVRGGRAILDFEPAEGAAADAPVQAIYAATRRLTRTRTPAELYDAVARELYALSGFDQILVYAFHADGHGEVVGEALADGMESYLGLHFPASDIPEQARRLYLTKLSRVIATSDYEPVPLDPALDPVTGDPVDLTLAELRSVSPHHLQFMRNMGQGATMSFSMISNGELIGMITCAHREPRRLRYLQRQGYELLASQVTLQLAAMSEIRRLRDQEQVRRTRELLAAQVLGTEDVAAALLRGEVTMKDLVEADAVAVYTGGRLVSDGAAPSEAQVAELLAILDADGIRAAVTTDALPADRPEIAATLPGVAGLIALPFGAEGSYLLWFRREIVQTVNWMGDMTPSNRLTPLSPRNSFSLWAESVTGRSLPWHGRDADARELARDVDAALLRRAESQLSHLGLHDALTDLPNRRLLMRRLEEFLDEGREGLALIFLDLDGFKAVNDTLGHEAGDELLVQAGRRIVASTRGGDIVARLGGDEFVVLCERAESGAAAQIAERIRTEFQAPFVVRDSSVAVTASVGIAAATPGNRAAELLHAADAAMYRAKRTGRNRVVTA
ncbi:MAG TPA: diguanylate cyclase, partial [Naasia sp.]